jgi:hypothetical protein
MPPNSEIDKLERRWKENPKGTVFAPYAEVLRKHGDYPMAKDVLRQGLELHPDHIPGNIVLGRCCLDLGEEGPAEAAFTHVLDLDSENVIALKALAEITERQGRLMEAESWLARLMMVDPSNDEARDQLVRVHAARESASVAMVAPGAARPSDAAETVVIQPATPAALEPARTQVAAGEVREPDEPDEEVAVEVALRTRELPPPPVRPPRAVERGPTVETGPLPGPVGSPFKDLAPEELDIPALAIPLEEPVRPALEPSASRGEAEPLGLDETPSVELHVSGGSEFQAPDDSTAFLDLTPGKSEFQVSDASLELRPSSGPVTEYQTPSGADELLKSLQAHTQPPAETVPAEPPAAELDTVMTSGFAAISFMPTEELPTSASRGPAPGAGTPGSPPGSVEPSMSVVDMLAEAGSPPVGSTVAGPDVELQPEVRPEADLEPVGETGSRRKTDLRLIFPDEADRPEPPKMRRVSEEAATPQEPEAVEVRVGEPEPVLTETMAELYARQGHVAEALRVYRVLAGRQPNDAHLAARVRELEATQAGGGRRMSYVAVDTGGESVESFFRALSDARPVGASRPRDGSQPPAAPTRPATDPLSLSAIFGEESSGPGSTAATEPAASGGPADSFSFDQFFGGSGSSATSTGPRQAMPPDEDLDQFQNWLKSLRR